MAMSKLCSANRYFADPEPGLHLKLGGRFAGHMLGQAGFR